MSTKQLLTLSSTGGIPNVGVENIYTTGTVYYVGANAVGAADTNDGLTPQTALSTLSAALALATANAGDVILVMPNDAETITGNTEITVEGVTILGMGNGDNRPVLTFATNTVANLEVKADNVTIENVIFKCNVDSQASFIETIKAYTTIKRCEFWEGTAKQVLDHIHLNHADADHCRILDCLFVSLTAGAKDAVRIEYAVDDLEIAGCRILGDWSDAGIHNPVGAVATNLDIHHNAVRNIQAGDHAIELVSACTGQIRHNDLYTNAVATALDPGSCECFDNQYCPGVDQGSYQVPLGATAEDFIGRDNADNNAATTLIVPNADGSVLEREEYIQSNVAKVYSDTTVIASDAVQIYSDTTVIASDVVQVYSDTTVIASDLVQIYSDTTVIASDVAVIEANYSAIYSDTTHIDSDIVVLGSDVAQVYSDSTIIASDVVVLTADVAQVYSDTTHIDSDIVVLGSDVVQVYSDTTVIASDLVQVYSDTTVIASDLVQVYSDTTVIASDAVQVYSDTTHIDSDVIVLGSDVAEIYSDTTIIASDALVIESDTTVIETTVRAAGMPVAKGGTFNDNTLTNNTQVVTLATATGGDIYIEELVAEKDATALTGPTNVEFSTDNVYGNTGADDPVCTVATASMTANTVHKGSGMGVLALSPFVLESGKKLYAHGSDAAGTSAGAIRYAVIGRRLAAGATLA